MNYKEHVKNGISVVELKDSSVVIGSSDDFLDLLANLPSANIVVCKENISESFFDLKTGIAGAILQKISNYGARLGIVGNFSVYSSKSLNDFIYESNRSGKVLFYDDLGKVLEAFHNAEY